MQDDVDRTHGIGGLWRNSLGFAGSVKQVPLFEWISLWATPTVCDPAPSRPEMALIPAELATRRRQNECTILRAFEVKKEIRA